MHLALDRTRFGWNHAPLFMWTVELSTLKAAQCCFQWDCIFNAGIAGAHACESIFHPLPNICFPWLTLNAEATTETNWRCWTWQCWLSVCLGVWLRLFFKVLFMLKCIKMMFFYFLKIIFKISTSKRSKTYKKKIKFLWNAFCTAFPNSA
jgi:hypothetical protein